MKKELKWTIILLLILFPLLAVVLLNNPERKNKEVLLVERTNDTSVVKQDTSLVMIDDDPEPEAEMMPDGRYPQNYFKLPVDFEVYLSGTFGELRSNHFHSGLDIRTGGVEGRNILATAEGYVSRINVSQKGYGNAIYVTHPNGYTSVYAHLQKFNKDIQFYVKKHQYAKKSFEVELYPEKGLIKVEQGQVIAYSGNTGGSGGPHLHFEIRKSNSGEPVNPLLFNLPVPDNLSPEILKLYVYQIDKNQREETGTYPFQMHLTPKSSHPNRSIKVKLPPGKYAIGAHLKDYFRSHSENLGVNYSSAYINNKLLFDFKIEKINFSTTRLINTHMDFCVHKTEERKTHKLFKDDGNKLDYYTYGNDKGMFELTDTTTIKLYALDLSGRKDSLTVTLIPDQTLAFTPTLVPRKTKDSETCKVYSPGQSFVLSHPKARISMPSTAMYFNYKMCLQEIGPQKGGYSPLWSFGENYVPVHVHCDIAIKVEAEVEAKHHSKLLLVEFFKGKSYPVGGRYKSGFVETSVRDLGTYYVAIDTTPPVIKPLQINRNNEFIFSLGDNLSGVKTFTAYLNKEWFLMEFEPKTGVLSGKMQEALKSGKHTFKLIVKDERGNESIFERTIDIP